MVLMYVTTVRVPDDLAERVKVYCALTGASVNGAVVVALEALTGRENSERSRPVGQDRAGISRPVSAARKSMCSHRIGPDAYCRECDG